MADVSSGSEGERDPVEALADEFAERLRRGERPAITEYTEKYPQWADRLRKVLSALVLMEDIRPETDDESRTVAGGAREAGERLPERLGDYHILREIGRGGMGIVYEAEQESLGRHVALKVLPVHALLDPKHLQRFRREAKAAARLHHTNIVPVFGVGEQGGLHYYVMQFIQGLGLDEVLAEVKRLRGGPDPGGPGPATDAARSLLTGAVRPSPAREQPVVGNPAVADAPGSPASSSSHLAEQPQAHYPRAVARIGLQVAGALQYAHGQGILHRDIKPSNLLLDAAGTVWVTDFGLAKAADSEDLTHTGDIVGTLRYMAPERFHDRADARSDVYGLGLTLYELLTLRPAFDETDRSKLVAQVMHTEPPRPRQVSREVPRDLETIVDTAIARNPAERYPTAQELADELRRFLNDEPIRARRPTLPQRAAKWVRRHPGLAATSAVAGVLLLLLVIVGLVVNNRLIRQEQARTLAALGEAAKGRQRARDALDEMSSRIIDDWLSRQPELTAEQKQFLVLALARYEEFTQETADTPQQRSALAGAYLRVGNIRGRLGLWTESGAAYHRSIELFEALARDYPGGPEFVRDLAGARIGLAVLQRLLGHREEAVQSYEAARALQEDLVREHPGVPNYARDLAGTYHGLAFLQSGLARWDDAQQSYQAARTLQERLVHDHAGVPDYARDLALTIRGLANLQAGLGQKEAALQSYEAARGLLERLVRDHPGVPDYAQFLAETLNNFAGLQSRVGGTEEALQSCEAALALQGRLVRDYPALPEYARAVTGTRSKLAALQAELGRKEEAMESYEAVRAVQQRLVRDHPGVPDYTRNLADTYNGLAKLQADLTLTGEALHSCEEARALREQLVREYPGVSDYAMKLGETQYMTGYCLMAGGDADASLAWYGKALATLEPLHRQEPRLAAVRNFMRNCHWCRADALVRLRRPAEALRDWDRAIALDDGQVPRLRIGRALALTHLGDHARAAAAAEELVTRGDVPANVVYDSARIAARCVLAAKRDAGLSPADQKELADRYAARAVALLHRALEGGFWDVVHMQKDTDLDALRSRNDFQQLLRERP